MRTLLSVLLLSSAVPALADTIQATSRPMSVEVYPDGAQVIRFVTFTVPAPGRHELMITDLPAATDPGLIQLASGDTLEVQGFNLRADRLPPREDPQTSEQAAAKAKIEELELAEQAALLALQAVQARVDAAEAQVAFLSSFSGGLPDGATPETIRAMAAMIGAETLAAHQTALAAKADLIPAQRALHAAQLELAKAHEAYAALPTLDTDYTALSVAVVADTAGEQTIALTQFVNGASWRPVYDLRLSRKLEDSLTIDRAVLVTQHTGEDWTDVALTLSTSRPTGQSAPSHLAPELRRVAPENEEIYRPEPTPLEEDAGAQMAPSYMDGFGKQMVAQPMFQGELVTYAYPGKVDIATGVDDLRLALDSLTSTPVIKAVAVPRYDRTAFMVASFANTTAEPLLPGEARLFREETLVGSTWLDLIAPGVEAEVGFGPIESVRIKREMPTREGGSTGIFTSSNALSERVIITVENTGSEDWRIRLLDQVPYTEQTDLKIEYTATPTPTETDVDGQRGILAWEFDLPPGRKETVTLEHRLDWPDGMVLQ